MALAMCCYPVLWHHLLSRWVVSGCPEQVLTGVFTYLPTLEFLHTVQIASCIPSCEPAKCLGGLTFGEACCLLYIPKKYVDYVPFLKDILKGGELQFVPMKNSFASLSVDHCCCKNFHSQFGLAVFEINSSFLLLSFLLYLILPFFPFFISPSFLSLLIYNTQIYSVAYDDLELKT